MSGQYPSKFGFRAALAGSSYRGMPGYVVTLPEVLRSDGYETGHIGKWHLGLNKVEYLPQNQGYDHSVVGHIPPGGFTGYFDPEIRTNDGGPVQHQGHLTEILTDRAIDFIQDRDDSLPFFLSVWYFAPHRPLQPPQS